MTFGPLGDLIHGGADLAYQGITLGHHTLDGALDKTGVSASIPPALHEISDGSLGLLRRGIHDVGSTSGNILKSFDTMSLHGQDKDIGGNLRNPRGQQLQHQGNHQGNGRPKCKKCRSPEARLGARHEGTRLSDVIAVGIERDSRCGDVKADWQSYGSFVGGLPECNDLGFIFSL
uniref:Uncharacterized protein n=1 Tax=Moniliophthora roreri TaxID=221103 RepID=A0A0W0G6T6_MONRR